MIQRLNQTLTSYHEYSAAVNPPVSASNAHVKREEFSVGSCASVALIRSHAKIE